MKTIRKILAATTVMPAMLLAQPGPGFAQSATATMQMAQAQPGGAEEQRKKEEEKKAPPHAPAAQPPHAPPAPAKPAAPPAPAAVKPPPPHAPAPVKPAPVEEKRAAPIAPVQEKRTAPPAPAAVTPPPSAPAPAKPAPPPAPAAVKPVRPATPPAGTPAHTPPAQGPQGQATPGQPGPGAGRPGPANTGRAGGRPVTPVATGVAAGLAAGVLAGAGAHSLADIHRNRHETHKGGIDFIREPGRTIIGEGGQNFIVHDETERFHDLGLSVRTERHDNEIVSIYDRPDGSQIITVTDPQGRLLRRFRRFPDGSEYVLIDNGYDGQVRDYRDDVVVLPPPPIDIPPAQYDVDADTASADVLYDTLIAPPIQPLAQRYTLDQVLYSPALRARMRSIDINTLNFDTGSWIVGPDQVNKLRVLGEAINKAVARNPNEVFLVEGFTDAVGNPTDNLSLSDRRAQSVAALLTREFKVPPENLTTQGYGQQYPKEQTTGPSRINRRVIVQRITPLLADTGQAVPR